MRIVAVHLLNDYSGSPKVLGQVLRGFIGNGWEVHLFLGSGRAGFLTDLEKVKLHPYWYRFAENRAVRLLFYFTAQFILTLKLLSFLKRNDVVYVNTVMPFAAGIAGKIKGCRVVYHLHETSVKPAVLKKLLFGTVRLTAVHTIFVSRYLAQRENCGLASSVAYNVLEEDFLELPLNPKSEAEKTILMVCSLKSYKGVEEFVRLSELLPQYRFQLVFNASETEISKYFGGRTLPQNLSIEGTQKNLHPFYQKAHLLLNLSHAEVWVETFGLTVLEAMAYGIPTIVPQVGGITELVDDGETGFCIDRKNIGLIAEKIVELLSHDEKYRKFSRAAQQKSRFFYPMATQEKLRKLILALPLKNIN